MANRRMLNKTVVESDPFFEMPADSQALYMHLVLNADDEGLVTTSYYLGLQRGCVYKENCNTGYKKEIIDLIEHLENKGELEYIYTILSTYLTPKKMGRKELSCRTQ